MTKRWKVGVLGATGMVGQRFVALLDDHPWFEVSVLAASAGSAGKTYGDAVRDRWSLAAPVPDAAAGRTVLDASDVTTIGAEVDFVFCAVDMTKEQTLELENAYARAETPVVSNNSAHRATPDVPMMIPEINSDHARVIEAQRKRLGTRNGFIAVKPNCSLQSYVPALHPLSEFGLRRVAVSTYQAVSGAGKTLASWPEMVDNVIPYIKGEEEKSEQEPLKIWGTVAGGVIALATSPVISAQCVRVPVSDGHLATVFVQFDRKPTRDDVLSRWREYEGRPQKLGLPSAPRPFLRYVDDESGPQTRRDRDSGDGMAVSIGRLRDDPVWDFRFVGLSHNTLRGAAGGAVLTAELLCADGYIPTR